MDTIALWENLENLKILIPEKNTSINNLCISEDWCILVHKQDILLYNLLIFREKPKQINIKQEIIELSCNLSMCLFLTAKREVWIWGADIKKTGLFGKDSIFHAQNPIIIDSLTNLSIISVSIGETHAAAITMKGALYTWGEGKEGELGDFSIITSKPSIVNSACIFKSKQVACGNNCTAICTEAGYLYIYGKGKSCKNCGGVNAYPYTFETLRNYYIDKIYSFTNDIIALSDTGRCFVVGNCYCLKLLHSNEKIDQIATCRNGIIGLNKEQNAVYMWKRNNSEWNSELYIIKHEEECKIVSGLGNSICIVGKNLNTGIMKFITKEKQIKLDAEVNHESERKSFEEILNSYGLKSELHSLDPDLIYNALDKSVRGFKSRILKKIQLYSYCKFIHRHTYSVAVMPIAILKAFQRIIFLNKSCVFKKIQNCIKNKTIPLVDAVIKIQKKRMSIYFKLWKPLKIQKKNKFQEKINIIACKKLVTQIAKKSKTNKKILFKIFKDILSLSQDKIPLLKKKNLETLLKIIIIYNKLECKYNHSNINKRFKILKHNANNKSPRNEDFNIIYIDPSYKIEIIPPMEDDSVIEASSPKLSQSFRIEYGKVTNLSQSLKINTDLNSSNSGNCSPSMSPKSDASPFVDKMKELDSFKAKILNKNKIKCNTEPKSPKAINIGFSSSPNIKRNTLAMGANKKKIVTNDKTANQKPPLSKEPNTPTLNKGRLQINTLKRGNTQRIPESINLSIPSSPKSKDVLCKTLVNIYHPIFASIFKLLGTTTLKYQNSINSETSPYSLDSTFSDLGITDSWKLKLYALGLTKFNRALTNILKSRKTLAIKFLKICSN